MTRSRASRVAITHNGVTTRDVIDPIDLGNLVGEYDSSGALLAHYDYGFGLLDRADSTASRQFFTFDALGNSSDLTGPTGSVLAHFAFAPFGALFSQNGVASTPFLFSGESGVTRESNGLDFMRNRYYDPALGAFTAEDPLGLGGGDIRLHGYVTNDPVDFVDPSGLHGGPLELKKNGTKVTSPEPLVHNTLGDSYDKGKAAQGRVAEKQGPYYPIVKGSLEFGIGTIETESGHPVMGGVEEGHGLADIADGIDQLKKLIQSRRSHDPNAKTAPGGFGSEGFLSSDGFLPYRIDFENESTATAPAQRVEISDPLDPGLDLSTFEFTDLGFGDTIIPIPAGSQHFQTTVEMTANGRTIQVLIEAGLRVGTREVYVTFQSIDPDTGLPPDVLTGFLAPEDGTGRGMGYVSYRVRPLAGLATGTQIRNVALVTFDFGETIATNQVDDHDPSKGTDPAKMALNTIDAGSPKSSIAPLPDVERDRNFVVHWSGQDDAGGSGVASYDILVSVDDAPFTTWLPGTRDTSATYNGSVGHRYAFASVATDNVGNRQPVPTTAQASTMVVGPADSSVSIGLSNAAPRYGESVTLTATVTAAGTNVPLVTPTGTVQFLVDGTPVGGPIPLAGGAGSTQLATLDAGPHQVTAIFSGSDSFAMGTSPAKPLTVLAAPLTITAINVARPYGDLNPPLQARYDGFVLGQGSEVLGGRLSLFTPAGAGSHVGAYPITPSGLASSNYAIQYGAGTLTVVPALLVVTADNKERLFRDGQPSSSRRPPWDCSTPTPWRTWAGRRSSRPMPDRTARPVPMPSGWAGTSRRITPSSSWPADLSSTDPPPSLSGTPGSSRASCQPPSLLVGFSGALDAATALRPWPRIGSSRPGRIASSAIGTTRPFACAPRPTIRWRIRSCSGPGAA